MNGLPEPSSPCSVGFSSLCEGGLESCYLNLMMYDMHEEVAKQFYSQPGTTAKDVTVCVMMQYYSQMQSGIGSIFPNALVDEFLFEPCGYSMNGLADGGFFTIHITPEAHCSYASFETNVMTCDYTKLVHQVLRIFRPKVVFGRWCDVQRFCMTFFNHMDLQNIAEDDPLKNTFEVQSGEVYSCVECTGVEKNNSFYRIGNYVSSAQILFIL